MGPITPDEEVRAELTAILSADETRLGQVFGLLDAGRSAEEIQHEFGLENPNFVWNYRRLISALLEGDLPTAPTVAVNAARRFRALLKQAPLTPDARKVLEHNLAVLEVRAASEEGREEESAEARAATTAVEQEAPTGIYVYALPHYLLHPYDPDSGRTLLKVGRSDRDVIERFRSQTRTTALPEEPVLLRVYRTKGEASTQVEREFHELLEAADHARSTARTGGTEWFLTSLQFLDRLAKTFRVETVYVYDPGVD